MKQGKKPLPPVKEFLEQMYGVELNELTSEEKAHIQKLIEQSVGKNMRQTGPTAQNTCTAHKRRPAVRGPKPAW